MGEKIVVKGWLGAEVIIRKGRREPYWEMIVKKQDGTLVKMIGRKCSKFLSEEAGEALDLGAWGDFKKEQGF